MRRLHCSGEGRIFNTEDPSALLRAGTEEHRGFKDQLP